MKRKDFVTLEKVGRGLAKIPGMPELIEEERAALRAAEFVEQTRKAAHLSQAALAKKIGVSQARISQMEKGEGRYGASVVLLDRVAKACGGFLHLSFEHRRL
jgi:DNA-binding XRE family transcriptional regulator